MMVKSCYKMDTSPSLQSLKSDNYLMDNKDFAGSQLNRTLFKNVFTPKIWSKYTKYRFWVLCHV